MPYGAESTLIGDRVFTVWPQLCQSMQVDVVTFHAGNLPLIFLHIAGEILEHNDMLEKVLSLLIIIWPRANLGQTYFTHF